MVIRILDRRSIQVERERVGPTGEALAQLRRLINQPNGVILFPGPTGSGKTTTLYSCIAEIASPNRKMLSFVDPVMMSMPYVTSCSINPRVGVTYPVALRSFMRQDPDIVLVGESRDLETLEMALEFSLTGHLVLTQLHTTDATSAIARLMDIGIEPYLVAATNTNEQTQRHRQKNCMSCRESYETEAS